MYVQHARVCSSRGYSGISIIVHLEFSSNSFQIDQYSSRCLFALSSKCRFARLAAIQIVCEKCGLKNREGPQNEMESRRRYSEPALPRARSPGRWQRRPRRQASGRCSSRSAQRPRADRLDRVLLRIRAGMRDEAAWMRAMSCSARRPGRISCGSTNGSTTRSSRSPTSSIGAWSSAGTIPTTATATARTTCCSSAGC